MTLKSEEVLVEALDGLLLQDIVDAAPSVQHSNLHGRVILSLLWALYHLTHCNTQTCRDHF